MYKKIAIFTQPLHNNYGGLLQAYALKEVLQDMGHEVVIINRQFRHYPFWRVLAWHIISRIKGEPVVRNPFLTNKQKEIISKNTSEFRQKYIPNLSKEFFSNSHMNEINNMGFDVLIVGSDQCWRPSYSPCIMNFFFDFAKDNGDVKRISYAASFGVDHWEFSVEDTATCKTLLQHFNAVSVREDSAVELVRDYLELGDAVHVLDPTMLLNTDHYKEITGKENTPKSAGNLNVYILDQTVEKLKLVEKVEKELGLSSFEVYPKQRLTTEKITKTNIDEFVFPSPATWLRGFQDARFVIADSFHGVVFSILYNVPFLAIANIDRGLTRFNSLLKMFGLEERLVTDLNNLDIENFVKQDIDWTRVNDVLEFERRKAIDFLRSNLF